MIKTNHYFIALLLLIGITLGSCVKNDFDNPPSDGQDPAITPNTTIAQLKALYNGTIVQVNTDMIISGIVVADDKSGNFYKSLVLQDSTGGINIRIDQSDFYTSFPIGRKIFVKCNGLYLGAYNELIQLGGSIDNSTSPASVSYIPSTLIGNYIFKGVYNQEVKAKVLGINDISNAHQNMLIELQNVEFADADTNQSYADAINLLSANRTIKDCSGNTIILRTSGYANFASSLTPSGKGTLRAVYQVFGTTKQLYIRDINDVVMSDPRCSSGGGSGIVDIISVRNLYPGSTTTIQSNIKIKGIVISDYSNANIDARNVVIQDSTGGIVVRFASGHTFALGEEIEVNLYNQELSKFSGLLQVNNVPNANAIVTGSGSITPVSTTIAQVVANQNQYESTLVTLSNVSITPTGATYGGSRNIFDGSATSILYTRTGANFANNVYPSTNVNITAIVSYFGTATQFTMRNLSDVQ
ncbi:MAG TPA: DUF5689 domain-containing protein [Bacteroidia bacterium]|nr:DUF5689 domain-containing protein [Bacteroidia bacterium]HNT79384.1 DUF5689 domain-containing protein [Bacteroidia bacterium]